VLMSRFVSSPLRRHTKSKTRVGRTTSLRGSGTRNSSNQSGLILTT
jgi:hypothetical protein